MAIAKITQLTATVIEYPYNDKLLQSAPPVPFIVDEAIYFDPENSDNFLDVEPYLNKLVVNNRLSFIVENETFGGNRNDPASGRVKVLRLTYSYNGILSTLLCKEKASVVLQGY